MKNQSRLESETESGVCKSEKRTEAGEVAMIESENWFPVTTLPYKALLSLPCCHQYHTFSESLFLYPPLFAGLL